MPSVLSPSRLVRCIAAVLVLCAGNSAAIAQQALREIIVTGTVRNWPDRRPVPGATVRIRGTAIVVRSDSSGKFEIVKAPFGVYDIEAQHPVLGRSVSRDVRLVGNATMNVVMLDLVLTTESIPASELLTAGSAIPMAAYKAPFAIQKLTEQNFPVAGIASPLEMLNGRAVGVTALRESGAPGADVLLAVRAPNSSPNVTPPLYIVDGVFVSNENPLTTQDIESLDIADIQVLKGPAASAYYGTRAIAGAIVITTHRGANLPVNRTQFSLRNEIGGDFLAQYYEQIQAHAFRTNSSGQYVNAAGEVVSRAQRELRPNGFVETPFAGPLYDTRDQFFQPGLYSAQTASLRHNRAGTNVSLSVSRNLQRGIVPNADGYRRQTVRLNADHFIGSRLHVGMSAAHTAGYEEPVTGSFLNLMLFPPDVDLRAPDATGLAPYVIFPDSSQSFGINPLAEQFLNVRTIRRSRTLASANADFRALSWLSFNIAGSLDRGSRHDTNVARWFGTSVVVEPTRVATFALDTGRYTWLQAGATLHRSLGRMDAQLAVRGESQRERHGDRTESFITAADPIRFDDAISWSTSETFTTNRVKAGFVEAQLGYAQKYFADLLFRSEDYQYRAGLSSMRVAASWIASAEPWFPALGIGAMKFRYSFGSIASNPAYSVVFVPVGTPSPKQQRPPASVEHEFGVDGGARRLQFSFTYATSRNESSVLRRLGNQQVYDQIETRGSSLEGAVRANVLDNHRGLDWDVSVVADRRRSALTRNNSNCVFAVSSRTCAGETFGRLSGSDMLRDKAQLPGVHINSPGAFDVDDEGYVVAVGNGNTARDGRAKNLWGTTVEVDGRSYPWGLPILRRDANGVVGRRQIGDGNADVQFGVQNTLRFKGFRLYTLWSGQLGGDVINEEKRARYRTLLDVDVDQSRKPDALRKPYAYYVELDADDERFVQSATYVNLAESSFGYTVSAKRVPWLRHTGASELQVDVIARNLLTATSYDGINLERRIRLGGQYDFGHPRTRTFTLATRLVF